MTTTTITPTKQPDAYYTVVVAWDQMTSDGADIARTMYKVIGKNGEQVMPRSYGERSAVILCNRLNKKHNAERPVAE